MAIKGKSRVINTKFWQDELVLDNFTSEDKVFWLYLLTNEKTNNLGAYKLSITKIVNETGYSKETILNIIKRFVEYHKVIKYDYKTNEIFIINYSKYNWTKSPTFKTSVYNEFEAIDSKSIKEELKTLLQAYYEPKTTYNELKADENIPFALDDNSEFIKGVIDIYNQIIGGKLTYRNKAVNSMILARKNEGYKLNDFESVLQYKNNEWKDNDDMRKYLVPSTLFSPSKFSSYLQQAFLDNGRSNNKNLTNKQEDELRELIAKRGERYGK